VRKPYGSALILATLTFVLTPVACASRQQATQANGTVTYTCVPPGNGPRLALDRDQDGFYNRDELVAGTDPANVSSRP